MAVEKSSSIPAILLAAVLMPLAAPPAPAAAAMPKQAEFCARLARVMAAATAGIETLRGKAREGGEWNATEALPGMHDCVIDTHEPRYDAPLHSYQCVLSKQDDAAAASADQESLRRLIAQCLGETWRVGEIRHPGSLSVFFEREKGEPSVQLTHTGGRNRWDTPHEVGLVVYPPRVTVTLKAPAGKAIHLDARIDIKAKDETARTIFTAIAHALDVQSFNDAEAQGRATIERKDAPLREVLDAVCAQAGCTWFLKSGEHGPQLWLERKKS